MPTARVNATTLSYHREGGGDRVVLVHGSWGDHRSWDLLTPLLVDRYEVISYDRRGTSGTLEDDVADLAALIQFLGDEPVHLVGNSFGASIALRTAVSHPTVLATVSAHEPPLFGIVDAHATEARRDLDAMTTDVAATLRLIEAGAHDEAARLFIETVAFGPGAWDQLPPQLRETFVRNAPTFLDEQRDPKWSSIDLAALAAKALPMHISHGEASRPAFRAVVDAIARAVPGAAVVELPGAGHVPHATHPELFAEALVSFFRATAENLLRSRP